MAAGPQVWDEAPLQGDGFHGLANFDELSFYNARNGLWRHDYIPDDTSAMMPFIVALHKYAPPANWGTCVEGADYPDSEYFQAMFANSHIVAWDWYRMPAPDGNHRGLLFPAPGSYNHRSATICSLTLALSPWRHHVVCRDTAFLVAFAREGVLPGTERLTVRDTQTRKYRRHFVMDPVTQSSSVAHMNPELWAIKHHMSVRDYGNRCVQGYRTVDNPLHMGTDTYFYQDGPDSEWVEWVIDIRDRIRDAQEEDPYDFHINWNDINTFIRPECV